MTTKKSSYITYESLTGPTGRLEIEEGETYLIIKRGERTIDINFKIPLISIYSNEHWAILPMDSNSKATSITNLSHIDQLNRRKQP